nr:hypothetical protein GCM10020241_46370 [Streptoalloteichus tenebrarius]
MARLLRLLTLASSTTRRSATPSEARQAVHAVRKAGLLFPARVACLEESAAAVLVLSVQRAGVRWCHGVAADPVRFHAWVETEPGRRPVAEPLSTQRYATIRAIPN